MTVREERSGKERTMDIKKECERRGWRLLNETPILDCESEEAEEAHGDENSRILSQMGQRAEWAEGLWSVTRRFIDPAHEAVKPRRNFVEPHGLEDLIQTADLKNGVDMAVDESNGALIIIANGQGYTMNETYYGIVTTVFECRLLDEWTAEAIRAMEGC